MKLFASLFLICVITNIDGMNTTSHPDLITHLPHIQQMPDFNMYAGYLKASKQSEHIFYWLNEATHNDSNRLLIWLNGGPGCSSLYGLFRENGPFTFNEDTGLTVNKLSWNQFAHTLYIDSPLNTGFSYSKKPLKKNQNDRTTAILLLSAIKDFFQVHPQYEDFDIFLAGESYAGVNIPATVIRLMKEKGKLAERFKGILLGNPYLNKYLNEKSQAEFSYSHGFIDKEDYKKIDEFDCYNETAQISHNNRTKEFCKNQTKVIGNCVNQPMDMYNIEKKCWKTREKFLLEAVASDYNYDDDYYDYGDNGSYTYHDTNATYASTEQEHADEDDDEDDDVIEDEDDEFEKMMEEDDCYATPKLEKYLNRGDVKSAIHAKKKITWKTCNSDVVDHYDKTYTDMSWRIKEIVSTYNKTVLLYYGDLDLLCNFMGGEEFVRGLKLKKTRSRRPFYLKRGKKESLAGHYEVYMNRLKFAVIKGAGHMSPEDQPAETFSLIRQWLKSKRHD